jgi:hypothetical protein
MQGVTMKSTRISAYVRRLGAIGLLCSICIPVQGQFVGNYPIGVEGIKGGTLPPPGFYLRDYNLFYLSNRINDRDGDEIPADFEAFGYANAIRPIWITKLDILGGAYGMDVLIPFVYKDIKMGDFRQSRFALGDVFVEPITLSWHWKQADLGIGYGFWAPTADYDVTRGPLNTGQGFWGHMPTLGATFYADEEKTWALSALARYEINHKHTDLDITPGQTLSLEWGLSKTLAKFYDVGVVGYWQQQTTEDSGSQALTDALDSVVAVGPEVNILWPKILFFTSLRYNYEFQSKDRPQGHTITLTLTKKL